MVSLSLLEGRLFFQELVLGAGYLVDELDNLFLSREESITIAEKRQHIPLSEDYLYERRRIGEIELLDESSQHLFLEVQLLV